MFEQLKRAVRRGTRTGSFRECRRCGTTVESDVGGCPACDSTDIAQYEL
jgi:rubrerythrin